MEFEMSVPERYSSSVYSSTSAAGGGGATSGPDGIDGDVEESFNGTPQRNSYMSHDTSANQNNTINGVDHPVTDPGSAKDRDAKGKKKLGRESFKNMGKALSGAFTESTISNKFKKHRSADRKNKKPYSDQNDIDGTNGDVAELETIHSHPDEDENDAGNEDPYAAENRQILYDAQPSSYTNTPAVHDDNEENEVDPEILARERDLDRIPVISIVIIIILLGGIVLGIILCAMIPLGVAFEILGPTVLGLSAFVLVYKIYVTGLWKEDPYRWCIKHLLKCRRRFRRLK